MNATPHMVFTWAEGADLKARDAIRMTAWLTARLSGFSKVEAFDKLFPDDTPKTNPDEPVDATTAFRKLGFLT